MDYDYWLRIGKFYPAGVINDYLAHFRWYAKSKSGADYRRQLSEAFETASKHAGQSRWPLWLHRLNSWKIALTYDIIRLFKHAK
jgi:hypothetical protein